MKELEPFTDKIVGDINLACIELRILGDSVYLRSIKKSTLQLPFWIFPGVASNVEKSKLSPMFVTATEQLSFLAVAITTEFLKLNPSATSVLEAVFPVVSKEPTTNFLPKIVKIS